ncbi:transporter substrate-binding domain-containing protein [Sphaerisporangium sp. NPDC051011]|uniref:transporter substrate-binding domain-containing protein n=1 Tax=Sphaerisporangium sp. NPDC051011 TaxID=3155792 RepID=UPI0033D150EE
MSHKLVPLAATTAVALFALTACGTGGSSDASASDKGTTDTSAPLYKDVPEKFRDGITIAIQQNAPPLSFKAEDGSTQGQEPELLKALSKQLGVPIKITPTSFENELLGLDGKKFDFVGQTAITAEREQKYNQVSNFVDGYSFVALDDSADLGTDEMDLCGHTLATQSGDQSSVFLQDLSKKCASAGKKEIKLVQLPSLSDEYVTVASGRAEAAIEPLSVMAYFLSQKDQQLGKSWKKTGPTVLPVLVGYSFLKDSPLPELIQKGVQALIDDGTYAEIMKKHGLEANIATEAHLNPAPLS